MKPGSAHRGALFAPIALLAGFCSPGWSSPPSFYSDRTGWDTAVGTHTDIGFEGLAPANGYVYYPTPPGLTLSSVNFSIDHSSNNGSLYVVGPNFYYTGNSALSSQQSDAGPQNIFVTLPSGTTGLALDFGDLSGSGGSIITFKLSDGQTFTRTTPPYDGKNGPSWFGFVGFTVAVPITSLEIVHTTSATGLEIDNFSYSVTQVPEPGTGALAGLSLLSLLLAKRIRGVPRRDVSSNVPTLVLATAPSGPGKGANRGIGTQAR